MAITPECSNHPGTPGSVIVSFLDPSVEEPTQVLCDECLAPFAASVLTAATGRDIMEWLFPPEPKASKPRKARPESPESDASAPPTGNGAGKRPGRSSTTTDEAPTATDDASDPAHDEAPVSAAAE